MDDDAVVIECQDAVRLITVREKSAGDSVTNYERDYGMAGHASVGIGIRRRGRGQKDRRSLFTPAISLALHIDDGDDGTLAAVLILVHGLTYASSERVRLFQSNFALSCAWEARVWVWYDAQEARTLIA